MEMFSSVDEIKRESVEWIDDDIQKLMRARNHYRTKHRKTKLLEDWNIFKDLRNEVRRRLHQAKERHYTSVCQI